MDDAALLAGLNSEVQRLHMEARPDFFKPAYDMTAIEMDFRGQVLANPDGRVLILEENGTAVGYIYAYIATRDETPYTYAQHYINIDQIGVAPQFQGKGYGRALMNAVYDWADLQDIRRITLSSWSFNVDAHAFFRQCGFEPYLHYFEFFTGAER
jgi:GNAT superfamily N-acetyltransferase